VRRINARLINTVIEPRQDAASSNHFLIRCRVVSRTHSFLHRTPYCRNGKPRFGEEEVNPVADWDENMDLDRIQVVEVALIAERE